jgi:energy-converting hydrogenase Eha subunit B
MRLAQQSRAVAVILQIGGQIWSVFRQGDAVGGDAVRANILTGQDRRTLGHANRVLVARLMKVQSGFRQMIDRGRPGYLAAITAQRVIALLVRGD